MKQQIDVGHGAERGAEQREAIPARPITDAGAAPVRPGASAGHEVRRPAAPARRNVSDRVGKAKHGSIFARTANHGRKSAIRDAKRKWRLSKW